MISRADAFKQDCHCGREMERVLGLCFRQGPSLQEGFVANGAFEIAHSDYFSFNRRVDYEELR